MRIIVCGGRFYEKRRHIFETLDDLHAEHRITCVITGGASGADSLGDRWAKENGVDRVVFPANWTGRGRAAGPVRNQLMLDIGKPDMVVAFPGGTGTADMVRRARCLAEGVKVLEVKQEQEA